MPEGLNYREEALKASQRALDEQAASRERQMMGGTHTVDSWFRSITNKFKKNAGETISGVQKDIKSTDPAQVERELGGMKAVTPEEIDALKRGRN